MKKQRKVFAFMLAIVMLLAMGVTAFAADITINNAINGQTYSAYKVFDVTTSTTSTNTTTYSYTIKADSQWFSVIQNSGYFSLVKSAYDDNIYIVNWNEDELDAEELAKYLNEYKDGMTPDGTAEAANHTAAIASLEAGYYFVDSSLGALCALNTVTASQTIDEKNSAPSVDKVILDPDPTDSTSASVGDTITFQTVVNAGGAADTSYIVHDTMSAGLTLNEDSFAITVDGQTVNASNYEIKIDGQDFTIEFIKSYTASLAKDTQIVIIYTAVLNDNAITGDMIEENEVYLTYGNSSTVEKIVTVETYEFELVKTDATVYSDGYISYKCLSGAEFMLLDADGNQIDMVLVNENENVYRPAMDGETGVSILAGQAKIRGLGKGIYYLRETKAPDGYNMLTEDVEVDLTDGSITPAVVNNCYWISGGVHVVNQVGSPLPSTGGIGTTIFYVVGGVLVLAAVVLLVTKKKMSSYKED